MSIFSTRENGNTAFLFPFDQSKSFLDRLLNSRPYHTNTRQSHDLISQTLVKGNIRLLDISKYGYAFVDGSL